MRTKNEERGTKNEEPRTRNEDAPLFDLQVNGFAGVDFQSDELPLAALEEAVAALRHHRTGRVLATLVSDHTDKLARRLEAFEGHRAASPLVAATVVGYHLEGPYLSPEAGYCGAHPAAAMKAPERAEFDRLQGAAGGQIRLVTLAPEWPGSDAFIAGLTADGVKVSLGHTNASEADIDAAVAAGATLCTHLGNAVPQHLHRHDNVVQRLLARDELTACFIPDGIHLPPPVLQNFVRAKPPGKVLFTTDCMAAAGAPPGRYRLGPLELEVGADRVVRQPGQPNFAGSALTLDRGVDNLCAWLGLTRPEAEGLCSTAVARALGMA